MAATLKLSFPISDSKPNRQQVPIVTCCNTTEVLNTSEDTNSLTVNTVFQGPKILPDTAVKVQGNSDTN